MKLDPAFIYGNYIEACLWAAIGIIAMARRSRPWGIALAGALVAFGISDIIETRTGAWYRPWWLLAWKAACIALILTFGIAALRAYRRGRAALQL
jgi:hypothetical protein